MEPNLTWLPTGQAVHRSLQPRWDANKSVRPTADAEFARISEGASPPAELQFQQPSYKLHLEIGTLYFGGVCLVYSQYSALIACVRETIGPPYTTSIQHPQVTVHIPQQQNLALQSKSYSSSALGVFEWLRPNAVGIKPITTGVPGAKPGAAADCGLATLKLDETMTSLTLLVRDPSFAASDTVERLRETVQVAPRSGSCSVGTRSKADGEVKELPPAVADTGMLCIVLLVGDAAASGTAAAVPDASVLWPAPAPARSSSLAADAKCEAAELTCLEEAFGGTAVGSACVSPTK